MADATADTVGALLIDHADRVLLGLRAPSKKARPDHWDAIGGRVEAGESIEAAMIREVNEEIGVTPTTFALIAKVRERNPERNGDMLHHIYVVTEWSGGTPANACDEHSELRWFDVAAMRQLTNIVGCDYPRLAELAMKRIGRADTEPR